MAEIEAALPEFRKRVCPDCVVDGYIRGQHGLAGYILVNPAKTYYYLTYVRNPFYKVSKQGIDKSLLIEANARFKCIIVKSMRDEKRRFRFYGCDAKLWYQYVTANDSWYDPPDEREPLGNIPLRMLYDMETGY